MCCVLICYNQLNYLMTTQMKKEKIYKKQQQTRNVFCAILYIFILCCFGFETKNV